MRRHLVPLGALWAAAGCVIGCKPATEAAPEPAEALIVDAACGQCRLGLEGAGCDLAVRIDGVAYFVDGTGLDDHGDAHAENGFCNTVRRARVRGHVEDGRFAVASFELLPVESP